MMGAEREDLRLGRRPWELALEEDMVSYVPLCYGVNYTSKFKLYSVEGELVVS
jgi:hypothetical protein